MKLRFERVINKFSNREYEGWSRERKSVEKINFNLFLIRYLMNAEENVMVKRI